MMNNAIKFIIILTSLFAITSLQGCSRSKLLTVYKIDIQQGNAVESKKVEQLEIGMSKEQVEFLLGTPLLVDSFHPDRWDYVYFLIPGFGEKERRHLTLMFNGDSVTEIIKHQIPPVVAEETPITTDEIETDEESKS